MFYNDSKNMKCNQKHNHPELLQPCHISNQKTIKKSSLPLKGHRRKGRTNHPTTYRYSAVEDAIATTTILFWGLRINMITVVQVHVGALKNQPKLGYKVFLNLTRSMSYQWKMFFLFPGPKHTKTFWESNVTFNGKQLMYILYYIILYYVMLYYIILYYSI